MVGLSAFVVSSSVAFFFLTVEKRENLSAGSAGSITDLCSARRLCSTSPNRISIFTGATWPRTDCGRLSNVVSFLFLSQISKLPVAVLCVGRDERRPCAHKTQRPETWTLVFMFLLVTGTLKSTQTPAIVPSFEVGGDGEVFFFSPEAERFIC